MPMAYLGGDGNGQQTVGAQERHLFRDKNLGVSIT